MEKFLEEGFYEVWADEEKNRLHLRYYGFWEKKDQVHLYVEHVRKSCEKLKPGFTTFAVIDDIKPPKFGLTTFHKEVQKIQKSSEIFCAAVVVKKKGQILRELVLKVVSRLSGLNTRIFNDEEEGLAWLDQQQQT